MKPTIFEKMSFIEALLFWEGKIGRKDIMDAFGISKPQATLEFKKYREFAPDNIQFDVSLKCYVPTKLFNPQFYVPNPTTYLSNLKQFAENKIDSFNPAFGDAPRCETVFILKNHIDVKVLRDTVRAIKREGKILIQYQGMEGDAKRRWIIPKYLFFDGIRWNIRAFCLERKAYRTFTVSRILRVIKIENISETVPEDLDWVEEVNVIITANPNRSEEQQEIIRLEHSFTQKEKTIKIKKHLIPYFLLANRLYPLDDGGNLVIKNKDEIMKIIEEKPIDMFR